MDKPEVRRCQIVGAIYFAVGVLLAWAPIYFADKLELAANACGADLGLAGNVTVDFRCEVTGALNYLCGLWPFFFAIGIVSTSYGLFNLLSCRKWLNH